jgi:hypothetical protein
MHRAIPTRSKRLVLKHETVGPVTTNKMPPTRPIGMILMAVALGELVDFLRDESYVVDWFGSRHT